MKRAFWAAQWLLAIGFELTGMVKLGLEADHVRARFGFAPGATTGMPHAVGAVEIALAALAIFPAALRILPRLSVIAAAALGGVAILGSVHPQSAAGTGFLGANLALLALASFAVTGRLGLARREIRGHHTQFVPGLKA